MRRPVTSIVVGLAGMVAALSVTGGDVRAQTQVTPQPLLTFSTDIQPILARSCWACHGSDRRSGLDLRTRAGALAGGRQGQAIVPGRSDASRLYRRIAGLEQPAMPMEGAPLAPAEIAAIRTWIDQGAHWDAGSATRAADAQPAAGDADSGDPPSAASDYWAFQLPVQVPMPVFPNWSIRLIGFSRQPAGAGV